MLPLAGKRVVVTGADGFAGRWLCRALLEAGYRVEGWARRPPRRSLPGVHWEVVDLLSLPRVRARLQEASPHGLIHLAARTHVGDCEADPGGAFAVNATATGALFAALPSHAAAVYVSTCHVYGRPERLPLGPGHPTRPDSVYARSKLAGEEAALAAAPQAVIARAFHHSGPDQTPRFALSSWAHQLRQGATRVRAGDLGLRRDYTDVRDVVEGYRLLLERGPAGEVVDLCSGEAPTLGELLQGLAAPGKVEVMVDPERLRPSDIPEIRGDPGPAEALGWRRRISREQMLREMRAGEPQA